MFGGHNQNVCFFKTVKVPKSSIKQFNFINMPKYIYRTFLILYFMLS